MERQHEYWSARTLTAIAGVLSSLLIPLSTARCTRTGPKPSASTTLRIGVGALPQVSPQAGVRQVVAGVSVEGLARTEEDGRLRPNLAENWSVAADGLSITIRLRPQSRFHDGTPVDAEAVAQALSRNLPAIMGAAFEDVAGIQAIDSTDLRINLHRRSRFVIEALDTPILKIEKTGRKGTGPYIPLSSQGTELEANASYYLGRPAIERVTITPYPTVRAAWAELLRGNLDMLYEVNVDALDSLEGSTSVAVFSFVRHYQYMLLFLPNSSVLQSTEVRRELNAAIDRDAIVRNVLNGHGEPSTGPIPPHHWALNSAVQKLHLDHGLASRLAMRHLVFTCLVPADSMYERVALAVKQQLAAAGVEMRVEEATQDQILQAGRGNKYDALLLDPVSGPTVFRPFRLFYSKVQFTPKPRTSATVDAALDRVRYADSDVSYSDAVSALQQTIIDDPPALFLAWSKRVRAVSRRFNVVGPEDGGDVLNTLRLWQPANVHQVARVN